MPDLPPPPLLLCKCVYVFMCVRAGATEVLLRAIVQKIFRLSKIRKSQTARPAGLPCPETGRLDRSYMEPPMHHGSPLAPTCLRFGYVQTMA